MRMTTYFVRELYTEMKFWVKECKVPAISERSNAKDDQRANMPFYTSFNVTYSNSEAITVGEIGSFMCQKYILKNAFIKIHTFVFMNFVNI